MICQNCNKIYGFNPLELQLRLNPSELKFQYVQTYIPRQACACGWRVALDLLAITRCGQLHDGLQQRRVLLWQPSSLGGRFFSLLDTTSSYD